MHNEVVCQEEGTLFHSPTATRHLLLGGCRELSRPPALAVLYLCENGKQELGEMRVRMGVRFSGIISPRTCEKIFSDPHASLPQS